MPKLLSGQSLYMAKSINAQRISQNVDLPEYEPPSTSISACVYAVSASMNPLDFASLRWYYGSGLYDYRTGKRIGAASYLFTPTSIIATNPRFRDNLQIFVTPFNWNIATFAQLRSLHYLTMTPSTRAWFTVKQGTAYKTIIVAWPAQTPMYQYGGTWRPFSCVYAGDYVYIDISNWEVAHVALTMRWSGSPLYAPIEVAGQEQPPDSTFEVWYQGQYPNYNYWKRVCKPGQECVVTTQEL